MMDNTCDEHCVDAQYRRWETVRNMVSRHFQPAAFNQSTVVRHSCLQPDRSVALHYLKG
jgi:hypothetical protein